jgi:hypothetical protein
MAFNGSGVWIAPTPVSPGTTIQSSVYNSNNTDIKSGFDNTVTRDGQGVMTGSFKIVDGTSGAPGIAFNAESGTGLFRPSNGVLALSVSAVQVAQFNSSGRLLLGTTTDDGTNLLQVNGAAKIAGTLTLSSNLAVTGTSQFTGDAQFNGNVGLGVAPAAFGSSGNLQISSSAMGVSLTAGGTYASNTYYNAGYKYMGTGYGLRYDQNVGAGQHQWLTAASGTAGAAAAFTQAMTLDASGRLGLGVTPSSWGSGAKVLQTGAGGVGSTALWDLNNNLYLSNGLYYDGSSYRYVASSFPGAVYVQGSGAHSWYSAAAGTAGNAATTNPRMVLDSSGNLLVGATSSSWSAAGRGVIEVNGSSTSVVGLRTGGSVSGYLYHNGTDLQLLNYLPSGALTFGTNALERGRFDNSGNFLVGTSTANYSAAGRGVVEVNGSSTSIYALKVGGAGKAYLYYNGTDTLLSNESAGALLLQTSAAERMRIDSSGNVLVGTTGSVWGTTGRGVVEVNGSSSSLIGLKVGNAAAGYVYHDGTNVAVNNNLNGSMLFSTNSTTRMSITAAGVIQDAAGNELGYKGIPQTTSGWTNGQCYQISAGVTASTSTTGNTYMVFNNSASSVTITQGSGLTMRMAGTTSTGNRTLLPYGVATLMFVSATTAVISGNIT